MPAYVQHHDIETVPMVCPAAWDCFHVVRDVEPLEHGEDRFIYECSDCGAKSGIPVTGRSAALDALRSLPTRPALKRHGSAITRPNCRLRGARLVR